MLKKGLKCNKEDPSLINNLAYCYLQNGDILAADELLSRVNDSLLEPTNAILISATKGLLSYRQGNPEMGKMYYQSSIELAKKKELSGLLTSTLLYYAKEALYQKEDVTAIVQQLKKCNINNDLFTKDFIKKYKLFID